MSSAAMETEKVLNDLQKHLETVSPGMPAEFTEAASVGDCIWQGDLCLTIIDKLPKDYVNKTGSKDRACLAPGGGEGSRHCIDDLANVQIKYPKGFNAEWEELNGPAFKTVNKTTVLHPRHGNVTIPAGFCVGVTYQREYDAEQKRERRARD